MYKVLLADPPWQYSKGTTTPSRAIEAQYPTMPLENIKRFPLPPMETNAALFLWATVPLLPEALDVMRAWDFVYKTNIVWDKQRMGLGHWLRIDHEHLLLGIRGKLPLPPKPNNRRSIIRSLRRAHSQKPEEAYQLIERMFPGARKIELFARTKRDGWETRGWGVAGLDDLL